MCVGQDVSLHVDVPGPRRESVRWQGRITERGVGSTGGMGHAEERVGPSERSLDVPERSICGADKLSSSMDV